MKQESFEYLSQFEEVFEIAYRSGYVRNIPVKVLTRLVQIYDEILGAKSGYNARNMCRGGSSCLPAFMLELRAEYIRERDKDEETPCETAKALKVAKKPKKQTSKTKVDESTEQAVQETGATSSSDI